MESGPSTSFQDLLFAYEWVSGMPYGENEAYVSRVSGPT